MKLFFGWMTFLIIAVVFGVQSVFTAPFPRVQQNGDWSDPVGLSPDRAMAWFPDIAADTTGRLHVVFSAGIVGYDSVLYSTSADGSEWSKVNDIAVIAQKSENYADATRPALWVGQDGLLNMSYGTSDTYFSHAPVSIADSAASWSQPAKLNGTQSPYFSRVIDDIHGVIHVVYTLNQPSNFCGACYHLFHRSSKDQGVTWSTPIDISIENTGSAKPQVITDENGNLFVVWESGNGGGLGHITDPSTIMFSASYDGGNTWSLPVVLSPSSFESARNVTIQIDIDGKLVVAWLGLPDNEVYYQTSSDLGKTWSSTNPISGIYGGWDSYASLLDDYSMAVDSEGIIHLVLVGGVADKKDSADMPSLNTPAPTHTPTLEINLSVLHLTWNGDAWSKPDEVTRYKGDVPEWPRLAISQGNVLNVVWFVRDRKNIWNTEGGRYRIWYARKETAAKAIPTVVPVLPTTIAPTAVKKTATPAALQTLARNGLDLTALPKENVQSKLYYTEKDYLQVVGLAIAPVALVILLIGLFRLRQRQ